MQAVSVCDDGRMDWRGELLNIHVAPRATASMRQLAEARLIAGVGIEGDRYATRIGTFSVRHNVDRQATLIEVEALEALARDHDIELAPHEHRRNLTTRGVPLNHLIGQYFRVGECLLYGGRLNVPCQHLDNVAGKKVFRRLIHRSGLNARIVVGGIARVGDSADDDPESIEASVRRTNEAMPLERWPEA
jgi:MOSC domain-containing protein YiiM